MKLVAKGSLDKMINSLWYGGPTYYSYLCTFRETGSCRHEYIGQTPSSLIAGSGLFEYREREPKKPEETPKDSEPSEIPKFVFCCLRVLLDVMFGSENDEKARSKHHVPVHFPRRPLSAEIYPIRECRIDGPLSPALSRIPPAFGGR